MQATAMARLAKFAALRAVSFCCYALLLVAALTVFVPTSKVDVVKRVSELGRTRQNASATVELQGEIVDWVDSLTKFDGGDNFSVANFEKLVTTETDNQASHRSPYFDLLDMVLRHTYTLDSFFNWTVATDMQRGMWESLAAGSVWPFWNRLLLVPFNQYLRWRPDVRKYAELLRDIRQICWEFADNFQPNTATVYDRVRKRRFRGESDLSCALYHKDFMNMYSGSTKLPGTLKDHVHYTADFVHTQLTKRVMPFHDRSQRTDLYGAYEHYLKTGPCRYLRIYVLYLNALWSSRNEFHNEFHNVWELLLENNKFP